MAKWNKDAAESFDKAMAARGLVQDVVTRAHQATPTTASRENIAPELRRIGGRL